MMMRGGVERIKLALEDKGKWWDVTAMNIRI